MIEFTIKETDTPHYNLNVLKYKRNGEIASTKDTFYNQHLDIIKNRLTNLEIASKFSDSNISLKEYLKEFNKTYIEVCKSLKKTL